MTPLFRSLDESDRTQLEFDYLTGRPTTITGVACNPRQRAACVSLNRERTRGIRAVSQITAPREPVPPHVWATLLGRNAKEWHVPLVSLQGMGIHTDDTGFLVADKLSPLPSGAEAIPYLDKLSKVVYKLFDLRRSGALGKRVVLERESESGFSLEVRDATLSETLEKLSVLHQAGAHPTEIVGLSDDGGYLVVKQPLAFERGEFQQARDDAVKAIHGVVPRASRLRSMVAVIHVDGGDWVVSDLHERNIMMDHQGRATIIDALTGPVSPGAKQELSWLAEAAADARALREGRPPPVRSAFALIDESEY